MQDKLSIILISSLVSVVVTIISSIWVKRLEHKRFLMESSLSALKQLNARIALNHRITTLYINQLMSNHDYPENALEKVDAKWDKLTDEYVEFIFQESLVLPEEIIDKAKEFHSLLICAWQYGSVINTIQKHSIFNHRIDVANEAKISSDKNKKEMTASIVESMEKAGEIQREIYALSKKLGKWELIEDNSNKRIFSIKVLWSRIRSIGCKRR